MPSAFKCIVALTLAASTLVAKPQMSKEDAAYKAAELPKLESPTLEEPSLTRWKKLITLAAENDDIEIANKVLNKKEFKLDGIYSTQYRIHLEDFMRQNPKLFLNSGKKYFGSMTTLAEFFVDETGDYSLDSLKAVLKEAPPEKQDKLATANFLNEVKAAENRLAKKMEAQMKAGEKIPEDSTPPWLGGDKKDMKFLEKKGKK